MTEQKFLADYQSEDETLNEYYLPNQLDEFDSTAYHIKWFMDRPDNALDSNLGNTPTTRIIAETAVTEGLSIDSLTIKNVRGFNAMVRSGTSTEFTMKITQSLGASLLDKLYRMSHEIGIENYIKVSYYLELSFKGRDRVTGDGIGNVLNKRWMWNIILTKFEVNVSKDGSTYHITGVALNDLGYTNETDLPGATSVKADTIGRYFSKLKNALNNYEIKDKPKSFQSVPDEYDFIIDPTIVNFKTASSNVRSSTTRNSDFNHTDENVKQLSYAEGSSISDIIVNVVGSAYEMHVLAKNQYSPEQTNLEEAREKSKIYKNLIKVHTNVELLKYDPIRKEYAKKITYIVTLYRISRLILQPGETEQTSGSLLTRYHALLKDKVLSKAYNYIYTGLNDQVLEVDINFNTAWYVPLPRQGGRANMANSDVGSKNPSGSREAQNQNRVNNSLSGQYRAQVESIDNNTKPNPLIVSSRDSNLGNGTIFGGDGNYGDGNSMFSVLYAQATSGADMVEMDLKIKGDPDWLPKEFVGDNFKTLKSVSELEPYEQSENLILFRYRSPLEADEDTGIMNLTDSSPVFSGIYGVIEVTHTFERGVFTQNLRCLRDKIINLEEIKFGEVQQD